MVDQVSESKLKDGLSLTIMTPLMLKLGGFTLFGLYFNILMLKLEAAFLTIDSQVPVYLISNTKSLSPMVLDFKYVDKQCH